MPIIDIMMKNRRRVQFNSSEYFIFPTVENATQPVGGLFGLQFFDNPDGMSSDPTFEVYSAETDANKFNLGQLFVAKYGLRIKFDGLSLNAQGQRIYSAQILIKTDLDPHEDTGLEVLSFTGIVVFMIICAWSNYRLKMGRVERENTFMYKIYYDIIIARNA